MELNFICSQLGGGDLSWRKKIDTPIKLELREVIKAQVHILFVQEIAANEAN